MDEAKEGIEIAARLGAECFLVVSGPRGETSLDQARGQLVEALQELAGEAEARGVRVGLEPIHRMYEKEWTFIHTIPHTLEIIEAVGSAALGVVFDTYHLWQEPDLYEHIKQAGERIFCVHINDWREPPRGPNDRVVMGDGVIPLREIIEAIEATGYAGHYSVEIFSDELWQTDYPELLARCRSGYHRLFAG